jgi:hypothetical protein
VSLGDLNSPSSTAPSLRNQLSDDTNRSSESLFAGQQDSSSAVKKVSYWKALHTTERPKQVCNTSILSTLGHLGLYHLPPVAITLALLGLYVRRIRWGDLTDEQLNFLQFAAKAHEILILISLTEILLQRICYSLLVEDGGVPLGLLSSPYHLGAPLQYLFSWELWSGLFQPGVKSKRPRAWTTGTVIVVTILLSVAAAPLSAIVMIPRQGWWQVYEDIPEGKNYTLYMEQDLYQTDLGAGQIEVYKIYNNSNQFWGDPLNHLLPAFSNLPLPDLTSSVRKVSNITYSNYREIGSNRRVSLTMDLPNINGIMALATSPMDAVALHLSMGWQLGPPDLLVESHWTKPNSLAPNRWKQPLVAVECAWNSTDSEEATFTFDSSIEEEEVSLSYEDHPGFKELAMGSRNTSKSKLPRVDYKLSNLKHNTDSPLSGDILFLNQKPLYLENGTLFDQYNEKTVGLQLCRIYARWEEVDVWVERGKSEIVQSQFDTSIFDVYDHFKNPSSAHESITMQKGWLEAIGQRRNETGELIDSEAASIWQGIINLSTKVMRQSSYSAIYLDLAIAVHITNALSRMGESSLYGSGIRPGDDDGGKPPGPDDTVFHETFFLGGYGYNINSSVTVPIALAILLVHVCIVFMYIGVLIFSRRLWLSSSWTSFGELLVLALGSEKHDLGSIGGGVLSSQTWSTPVSVRVVGDEGKLEMVLGTVAGDAEQTCSGNDESNGGLARSYSRVESSIEYH